MSTNLTAGLPEPELPAADLARAPEVGWGGFSASAWLKIGIVAVLMALLFRFNLSRLWLKTNPITGQENWSHAFFIPLIGLYYLYVHREELISPRPVTAPKGSIGLLWGIVQLGGIAAGFLLWAAFPRALDWLESAVNYMGLVSQYHGWRIAALYLFVPYLVGSSVAVVVLPRRPELARKLMDWAAGAWPPLGAWLMLALMAWGVAFFVYITSQRLFDIFRVGLGIVSLASLATVAWATSSRSKGDVALLADRLLAGSAGWLGGFILGWGVLFSLWGIFPGQNDFFKDVGMVVALFGIVLLLSGWGVMRIAWFPILFLFCGLPWPDQIYSWVAGPLQHLAAAVAVRFLTICNIPSTVAGTKIMMFVVPGDKPRILNVEEACAGLRSLMTFVTLAGGWAFVFMSSRPLWHRLIQAASAVPIAIFCNVLRVSCTGLTDKWWGHEFSEGFAHRFVGLLLLVPAFFLILLVGWVLDNLFIEEADDEDAPVVAGGAKLQQRPRAAIQVGNKIVVPNRPAVATVGAANIKVSPETEGGASSRPQKRATPAASTSSQPAPAKKPAAGIRPPSSAVKSASQVARPRPATLDATAAADPSAGNKATQSANRPAARRTAEKPVGKPGQDMEGM